MQNFGLSQLPSVALNKKYLDRLARIEWVDVRFSPDYIELIIGDRACLLWGDLLGTCLMILPLGPRRALFAASDRATIERLRKRNQRQLVKYINRWSTEEAIEYFYSADDQHRALAKRRLRQQQH